MNLRGDAQMSPAIAAWVGENFGVTATAVRDLGLRDASDREIFEAARREGVIVMTKDSDFVSLLDRFGPPPQVIWVRCGNTSDARPRQVLARTLPKALELLNAGERLVEINSD